MNTLNYAHHPKATESPDWIPEVEPWPEPVNGHQLLDELAQLLRRFVILPPWAEPPLALWVLHTYAFHLRDVTTYLGVESPEKRCGKTTLLALLSELVNRPVVASNISSPAFFRVIEETRPTLLIDEADTFLQGNDELRGILNSGYSRKTAFVVRVSHQPGHREPSLPESSDPPPASPASRLVRFSCWCPKVMAAIGRLPDTLADRCILIRMQRKLRSETCERLRTLQPGSLQRRCARFVADHAQAIASARPELPAALNDRAADIWEPLLALADLAGGPWPEVARQAALNLTAKTQETNPIVSLLLDIFLLFAQSKEDRLFSQSIVDLLNARPERPWAELRHGKPVTVLWLSQQLRPYGIRPTNVRLGAIQSKGYRFEDFQEVFRRYLPPAEVKALRQPQEPENREEKNPKNALHSLQDLTNNPKKDQP